MPRIIVASASDSRRMQLCQLLSASGYEVFRACASGSALRRAMNECDDGVVIIGGAVPDCRPDELVWDFEHRYQILWVARPDVLDACDSAEVFRLKLPCPANAVVGATEMLAQLHRRQLPRREGGDKALVERAKRLIMSRDGLSEPEAHRRMQQYAMRHNMKMTDYATELIKRSEGTEE